MYKQCASSNIYTNFLYFTFVQGQTADAYMEAQNSADEYQNLPKRFHAKYHA